MVDQGPGRETIDAIIDHAGGDAATQNPAQGQAIRRHLFAYAGFLTPMEFEARLAAAGEEFHVAAAEKIERGIEGRVRQPFEYATRDQAIPRAVNHRHGTALR